MPTTFFQLADGGVLLPIEEALVPLALKKHFASVLTAAEAVAVSAARTDDVVGGTNHVFATPEHVIKILLKEQGKQDQVRFVSTTKLR